MLFLRFFVSICSDSLDLDCSASVLCLFSGLWLLLQNKNQQDCYHTVTLLKYSHLTGLLKVFHTQSLLHFQFWPQWLKYRVTVSQDRFNLWKINAEFSLPRWLIWITYRLTPKKLRFKTWWWEPSSHPPDTLGR